MIKELTLPLGALEVVNPLEVAAGQVFTTGWYVDQATGLYYYYDAIEDQWYYYAAGYIYPMAISWKPSPSPMITLAVGDTLRVRLSFYYKGPARTQNFYMALGANRTSGWFDEWGDHVLKNVPIPLPRCDVATLITDKYIDVPIVGRAGAEAAAYCKLSGVDITTEGVNSTPQYYNVCKILPAEGEFSEFKISKFEKV